VNTLELTSANNDVGQAGAVLENENCILVAVLAALAGNTTVKLAVSKIDRTADDGRLRKGNNIPNSCGNVKSLGRSQAAKKKNSKGIVLHRELFAVVDP
jgi:hypothetical protein